MLFPWPNQDWLLNPVHAWLRLQQQLDQEAGAIPLDDLRLQYRLPDSQFLELDGMQVHYRDVGRGPVLVLLHGLMASLHTWNAWTAQLQQHYRVISLDLPNFGLTGPHPKGMQRYLYSDFLEHFLQALDIHQCAIAGNSLGGWVAWEYAARYPQRATALILIDSAGYFFVPPPFMMTLAMPGGGWLYARTRIPRQQVSQLLKDVYYHPERVTADQIQRYHDMLMASGARTAAARVMRFIRDQGGFDTSLLARVKQPVLIQWGADDPWLPLAHAREFQAALADARLQIYAECGHLVQEELASVSADDCRIFLTEVLPARQS